VPDVRKDLSRYKILIIRNETNLIKLCLGFFPDIYIHDIKLRIDQKHRKVLVSLYTLNYNDRGIAIGKKGNYIKTVNEVLREYVEIQDINLPIEMEVIITNL
jgi:transcription antitermination factor NusA-like protein